MAVSYLDFCKTEHQRQCIAALIQTDWNREEAARMVGVTRKQLRDVIRKVKRNAAVKGYSPEHNLHNPLPYHLRLKGTSVLRDRQGNVVMQWEKSREDADRLIELREGILKSLSEDIPRAKPVSLAVKKGLDEKLVNLFVITDYHFGMYAWDEETRGGNWDLDIAEDRLVRWFEYAIATSPPAKTGILCFLGDSLHWDGLEAVTPASKHILDADTRFQKVLRMYIRVRRRIHDYMLRTYARVEVKDAEGNHDPVTSIHSREWWDHFYEDDPRINIDTSPDPYYAYEFGDVSLFFHHGHKKRIHEIDKVFASKFREIFGRTKYSYGHMGHLHHKDVKESQLMVVEQHRTLAERDAYASRYGFLSGREAQRITYHADFGEVDRGIVTPRMLK